jgi:hypothetical protein
MYITSPILVFEMNINIFIAPKPYILRQSSESRMRVDDSIRSISRRLNLSSDRNHRRQALRNLTLMVRFRRASASSVIVRVAVTYSVRHVGGHQHFPHKVSTVPIQSENNHIFKNLLLIVVCQLSIFALTDHPSTIFRLKFTPLNIYICFL